jgi:hypothetical protein
MTWKVVCSGKEKMSGEGEIAWSGPTYTGKMTMHSADGDMLMKMKGRDLGETCDAGETKRTADAIRAQAEQGQRQAAEGQAAYAAAMKKACDDAVRDMQVMSFTVMQTCKDRKADFCARMVTRSGYIALLKDGTRACGKDVKDLDALKPQFCAETAQVLAAPGVLRDNSKRPDVAYLAGNCPAEAQVLAQRECAGMSYTGMEPGMAEYCVKYARKTKEAAPRPEAQPASPQDAARKAADDPAKKASDDAKKAVKGLFGF